MPNIYESDVVRVARPLTADKAVELVQKHGAYALHLGSAATRVFTSGKIGLYTGVEKPVDVSDAMDAIGMGFYYGDLVQKHRGVEQYAHLMADRAFDDLAMSKTHPLVRIWYIDKAMHPTIRTIKLMGWSMEYAGCIEGECQLRGEMRTFSRKRIVRYEVL